MTRNYWLLLFIFILFSCDNKNTSSYPEEILFPKGTHTILQINQKDKFLSSIDSNVFWKSYMKLPNETTKEVLHSLPNSLTYWLTYTDKDFFIISSKEQISDTLLGWEPQTDDYFTKEINGNKWYYKKFQNRFIISEKSNLNNFIEDKTTSLPSSITKLKNTTNSETIANLFINKSTFKSLLQPIFNKDIAQKIEDWLVIDLFLDKKSIKLNGASLFTSKDSTSTDFSKGKTEEQWKEIIPAYISQVSSYSVNPEEINDTPDFTKFLYKVNIFTNNKNLFISLNSKDIEFTLSKLPIISEYSYEEKTIYELSDNEKEIHNFLRKFGVDFYPAYVTEYQNNLIFTETKEELNLLLSDIQQNILLSSTQPFQSLEIQMASKADETFISSLGNNTTFKKSFPQIVKKFPLASLQISSINNFSILNFISEESDEPITSDLPKNKFTITLNDTIITSPEIVLNHRTKQKEIIFQNSKNELILISNKGEILFKKTLDNPINSKIYQVDLFKNGFLQYAFSTQNTIWVIDRNGNQVKPYPKKYNGIISPLEIYDYSKNRDYRFMTVENGTKMHLLNGRGENIKGFSPPKSESLILQTPKHFRIKSNDYLVYPTQNGILKILHRDGRIRIPITENFDFSNNPILISKEGFSFTTLQGKIVDINTFGNIKHSKDSLGIAHHRTLAYNLEVSLAGTDLKIGNKFVKLPESEYQTPKIYKIGNNILISIFDNKNHKIYLYDQEGRLKPHFPMASFLDIDIKSSEDKKIIMTIVPEPNKISLCELN